MNQLLRNAISILFLSLAMAGTANASIIFQDNFDSYNSGVEQLNFTNFGGTWTVTYGAVDLIGNGGANDFLPGNGLYIDLDGTTGVAGIMGHLESLSAGDYTLSFDLAGNQRNSATEVTTANVAILVGSGTAANQSYSLAQNTDFTTYSLDFSISPLVDPSLVMISFGATGGDYIGMLLDNVSLQTKTTVPEPVTLSLLGIGLLAMGFSRKKIA